MEQQDQPSENYILILEDDRGTCELEAQRLTPLGLPVRKAFAEEEAAQAMRAGLPRLMLVDYSLPGGNALDFINSLPAAGIQAPPFIVVTGRGDEKVAVEAMKAGACDYLVKNYDFLEALLPKVQKALEKLELTRELTAAQETTKKTLRLYTFLAQMNHAAARRPGRQQLLQAACEIAVNSGGMKMAWVGLPDRDMGRLLPACHAGSAREYLKGLRIDLDGGEYSRSPMGQAALKGKISTSADIGGDPSFAPWREKALAAGFRSAAAIPLLEAGKVAAVLGLYSQERDFFSREELQLLSEIQGDLSLAIEAMGDAEKRAEAQSALERTAAQLAHIMDVTPVILFTLQTRPSGEFFTDWVSGNGADITGYTVEEILSPNWWTDNLHPEDKGRVLEGQKDLLSRKSLTQDFRFRRKDGSYFWVHGQLNISKSRQGEITGSWTDITRLKESEERFQELFEKAPIGYQSLDENGNLLAVNDTWVETFGCARDEAVGRNFGDFLADDYKQGFRENFPKFKSAGKVAGVEFEIRRKDGERRHIVFNGRVAHNQDGSFRQTHCVFTDVTATWKESRQRKILNEAINASSNEVYVFDAETFKFIFVNQGALSNLGYSREELDDMTPWDLKPEYTEASFRAAVEPLAAGRDRALLFETAHRRKDGSTYPVEVRLQHIAAQSGQVYLAVINDITERKKAERMMREMASMQRVESLGALAGGIAHDFNNMLTGIMANLSLLAARLNEKQDKEIISDTLEAARSAQVLTQQLMAFAKGGKPVKKEFRLERPLKEIFNLSTRGSSCAHELNLDESLWSVEGDEGQIKQAVNNLLVNALQAMPAGGTLTLTAGNLRLEEERGPLPPGNYLRLTVSDAGIGIPADYLTRIFEPYFTTKSQGHGLGLPMTWSVVKNHGGHIEVSSEPGKGTRFEILLPATGRCLAPEKRTEHQAVKGSGRILLLEDEDLLKKAAMRMLKELGYEPVVTVEGRETLKAYKEAMEAGSPFAAVIMDLTIPGGMGGKEAVAELRKLNPAAKVIVSSGYSDEAVMADYKAYGFDAVLPKPYTYEQMAETLARLLG